MIDLTPEHLRVAALCVQARSIYKSIPGVDCWDEKRDVRTFNGGQAVVAHPPCRSWSAFTAHQAKLPPGEKELGPICVEWLIKCGGVLEHPAHSRLFEHCGLPRPGTSKGHLTTVHVRQSQWGYPLAKHTWLCFSRIHPSELHFPQIRHDSRAGEGDASRWTRMSKIQRAKTIPALAYWLVNAARRAGVTPAP